MGMAEIVIGAIATTVAGGAWSAGASVNAHLRTIQSEITVMKWRLNSIEAQLRKTEEVNQ